MKNSNQMHTGATFTTLDTHVLAGVLGGAKREGGKEDDDKDFADKYVGDRKKDWDNANKRGEATKKAFKEGKIGEGFKQAGGHALNTAGMLKNAISDLIP